MIPYKCCDIPRPRSLSPSASPLGHADSNCCLDRPQSRTSPSIGCRDDVELTEGANSSDQEAEDLSQLREADSCEAKEGSSRMSQETRDSTSLPRLRQDWLAAPPHDDSAGRVSLC